MDDSTQPTTPPKADPPTSRRRWRRPVLIALICLIAAWALLAHSPLTRALVVPRLEALVGAKVYGGSASLGLDGTVTLRNISLRVTTLDGDAGAVFKVKRLRAWPNWARIFGRAAPGEPMLGEVEMVEPLVRISQSVDDGSLNIFDLTLPIARGTGPTVLPPLTVEHGTLELGEHRRAKDGTTVYTVLRRLDIDGQVKRARDAQTGVYTISAQQIRTAGDPGDGLIDLSGTFGERSVSLTLRGLSLNDWPPASIPSRLREIFNRMDLRGRVSELTFAYDEDAGVRASLDLQGVAVNLPIDAAEVPLEGPVEPQPPMRMHQVNGSIRFDTGGVTANLDGLLEDLPYHVAINYQGTSADSPFTCDLECRNFKMEEKPQILRFAHPIVKYRLAQFSNPTATVSISAHVSRAPPAGGAPADVKVSGTLDFVDGVAAYETFPYQFRDLRGRVYFSEESIQIVSLSGNSTSGATVSATATIGPLTDSAAADIRVECRDVPVDDKLEAAMGPQRRKFVTEIASTGQYQRLADAGVILPPHSRPALEEKLAAARAQLGHAPEAERAGAQSRVADLERRLGAPPFTLKGKGDVSIAIQRTAGDESIWTEIIEVRLGSMGLVPERFPIPIVADGVTVVIDGETIKVSGGQYRGLSGGAATVNATMRYPSSDHPDIDPMPQIDITATDIPADERLIAAVSGAVGRVATSQADPAADAAAGPAEPQPEPSVEQWIHQVLHDLGMNGAIGATAHIASSDAGTTIVADATTSGLSATPAGARRPALDQVAGSIHVTEQRVAIDLTGRADARADAGDVRVRAVVNIAAPDENFVGPPSPTSWTAVVGAVGMDTGAPAEDLVRVFSPEAADRLVALRDTYKPSGTLDALVVQSGGGPAGHATTVELSNAQRFEFDALEGRASAETSRGVVRIESAGEEGALEIAFDAFTVPLSLDGSPSGTLRIDGLWRPDQTGDPAPGTSLDLNLTDGAFESPLTRRLIAAHTGAGLRDLTDRLSPSGRYDSRIELQRAAPRADRPPALDAAAAPAAQATWSIKGLIQPKSIDLTMDGVPVHLPKVTGEVAFSADSGSFHLQAQGAPESQAGESWTIGADGSWVIPVPGSIALQTDLSVDSPNVPPGLLPFLPTELTSALSEIQFKVDGRFTIPKTTIHYSEEASPGTRSINAEGTIKVEGASFDIGAAITDCRGTLQFTADRSPGQNDTPAIPARYDLWAALDSFRVAGIAMTDGRVRIAGGEDLGPAIVPLISADCYGGRLAGDAKLTTLPDGQKNFETKLHFSGVRFAPLLADLTSAGEVGPPLPTAQTPPPDESRGVMDATLSLGGIIGKPESRRGRGAAVIGGGSVLDMPLLLPLIKFSNLQLPMSERLNLAHGSFYIEGSVVAFEELSIASPTVMLYGYGTVGWPDTDLNLRFNSRSLRRVPILSGLIETVRDELISTVVTGTVKDPVISTKPLPGTTEILDRIFGSSPTSEERRMEEIRARAERAAQRVRTQGWRSPKPAPAVRPARP